MSLRFPAVGARATRSVSPALVAPFTAGLWVNAGEVAGAAYDVWSVGSTANGDQYWDFWHGATDFIWEISGPSGFTTSCDFGAQLSGWYFVLIREISSTNHRLSVMAPDGRILHNQTTGSAAPSNATTMYMGQWAATGTSPNFVGNIAEYWLASGDIFPGGAVTPDPIMRELACRGPFAVDGLPQRLLEYHSFRTGPMPGGANDRAHGAALQPSLVFTSCTLGRDPPYLSGAFEQPNAAYATVFQ